jgi:hypothetical protein
MSDTPDDDLGTPDQQEFWRAERNSETGISLVKRSTAKPVPAVDPYSPVVIPES